MKKQCVWEKYVCPWNTNQSELDYIPPDQEFQCGPEDDDVDDCDDYPKQFKQPMPMLGTPFGVIVPTEYTFATKQFDFWILHTNFDVTENVIHLIESVPGVETVEPVTRYRLRIGFPRTNFFNITEVKQHITDSLTKNCQIDDVLVDVIHGLFDNSDVVLVKLNRKIAQLYSKYLYWTIYVLPNAKMDYLGSDLTEEIGKKIEEHKLLVQAAGGIVITHNDLM